MTAEPVMVCPSCGRGENGMHAKDCGWMRGDQTSVQMRCTGGDRRAVRTVQPGAQPHRSQAADAGAALAALVFLPGDILKSILAAWIVVRLQSKALDNRLGNSSGNPPPNPQP